MNSFPQSGSHDEQVAARDQETPGREAERMVNTALAMVTAYEGMLGASFWVEYGALKSEIEEFERTRDHG